MTKEKIIIVYWAATKLKFIEKLKSIDKYHVEFIQVDHHSSWFKNKNYLLNIKHLVPLLFNIFRKIFINKSILFGTNLVRIYAPFSFLNKKIIYVYNELPELSSNKLLFYYDKLIFKSNVIIYVSSDERKELINRIYCLNPNKLKVLYNLPILKAPIHEIPKFDNRIIFSGSITKKRFSSKEIMLLNDFLSSNNYYLDIYGFCAEDCLSEFNNRVVYCGHISHDEMLGIYNNYKFGLLSYYLNDLNYEYCAPIKLYEYINYQFDIFSVNRNKGFEFINNNFPGVINYLDGNQNVYNMNKIKLMEFVEDNCNEFISNVIRL